MNVAVIVPVLMFPLKTLAAIHVPQPHSRRRPDGENSHVGHPYCLPTRGSAPPSGPWDQPIAAVEVLVSDQDLTDVAWIWVRVIAGANHWTPGNGKSMAGVDGLSVTGDWQCVHESAGNCRRIS
jgi:hypothetical protein